ncbi:MAG: branched-chain amino acid transport [Firmicutes bacterium]|nr:branched-chain amino acid transport [Bacillota bacterium]
MNVFYIIVGMMIVTYIPRCLPVFMIEWVVIPRWLNRWLKSIPYAVLGALIFPGILTVDKNLPLIGVIGGVAAIIISYLNLSIIYVVFGSIMVTIVVRSLLYLS